MSFSEAQWTTRLTGKKPNEIAKQILGDLTHYRHGGAFEQDDRNTLINAINALIKMVDEKS